MKGCLASWGLLLLPLTAVADNGPAKSESYRPRPFKAVTVIVDAKGNPSLSFISLSTLRRIYDCTITHWKDVPGSDRSDKILPLALVGPAADGTKLLHQRIPQFKLGSCVTTISGPDPSSAVFFAIGTVPPNKLGAKENFNAIGYLNYGPLRDGHKALAIIDDLTPKKPRTAVAPSEASIKNKSYALIP